VSWFKKLLPSKPPLTEAAGSTEFYIAPSSESEARAETALPGTADLAPLLTLVPPPLPPVQANAAPGERDYAPDLIAEFSVTYRARNAFDTAPLLADLTRDQRAALGLPTLHIRLPTGRITYLLHGRPEPCATELITAWSFHETTNTPDTVASAIARTSAWLAPRPEGFEVPALDMTALINAAARARAIQAVTPSYVAIDVTPRSGTLFDGRRTWDVLHALGIPWGDMDQFQWHDESHWTDYLFWVAVDDGEIGYALPEEIAAGRQHFRHASFHFDIARSRAPQHVLDQMLRAATRFAAELGGDFVYAIDGTTVVEYRDLARAIDTVIARLGELGVEPGSHSVCMLR
jgi:hypothetical protein